MNCRYTYGSLLFNSELELDDFLLSKGPELLDKYGDLVFQELSEILMRWLDEIEPILITNRNEPKGRKVYNRELLSIEELINNRVAVTAFLSGLKIDGKYLFPEFDDKEYFKKRVKLWKSNEEKRFTEKELADFSEEPEFKDNKIPEVMTLELVDRLIKIEKEKWDHEARVGTAIHNLCELFFKRLNPRDKANLRIWGDEGDKEILEMFSKRADNETLVLLSTRQRLLVLNYCRLLRLEIESTHTTRVNGKKTSGKFLYFPELKISASAINPENNEKTMLSGMVDLLVVPVDGDPFIVDYKVSPANYEKEADRNMAPEDIGPDEYNTAKKLAFRYQLATYSRMLKSKNVAFRGMKTYVAPIQLLGYKKNNGIWNFDDIRNDGKLLDDLTQDTILTERIHRNLDSIFADIGIAQIDDSDILKNIKNQIKLWFTQYKSKELGWSFKEVQELIEDENNKYEENKEAEDPEKRFSYKIEGGKTIYGKTKAELIGKILAETESSGRFLLNTVINFILAVKHSNEPTRAYSNRLEHLDGDAAWYSKVIRKYVKNGLYQVLGLKEGVPDIFRDLGIVLLKNVYTDNIEVIKFTNEKVDGLVDRRNVNKLITLALGISDITDRANKNFLLEAVHGNVAIMETLLALNYVNPDVFAGSKVHSIKIVNPFFNSGLTASNKLILNSFKTLTKYRALSESIKDRLNYEGHKGTIKFCTAAEQARDTLRTGFKIIENNREGKNIKNAEHIFNRCLTPLENALLQKDDEPLDVVGESQAKVPKTKAEALYNSIIEMEDIILGILERTLLNLDFDITDDELQVQYLALLRAYAEELGYDFKLQVKAFDNYKDSMNIFLEGHSGLRTDNPGTTASDNLNKITEFIDDCYKRVTDFMLKPHAVTLNLIKNLKKEKRISYLGDSTFQNSIRIYDKMTNYRTRKAGEDWLFVNPWDDRANLSLTERALLKEFVTGINTNRFKKRGESDNAFKARMIQKMNEGDAAWLRVPLSYKGTLGKLETLGLFLAAKDYFQSWKPSQVKSRLKKEMSHLLTPEGKQLKDDIYAMRTRFDRGEDPRNRAEMLKEIEMYDHDLLSVFLKHMFGYKLKEESLKAFTLIKAAHADIILQEFSLNRERAAEKSYLLDNVKIMAGRNLMEGDSLIIYEYAKKLMRAMSVSALGFNPKQIYLLLEGIYKDIGIIWRNEDGRFGFTLAEMIASFANTYKEMGKFGYTPTKLERLNQLYRINDMDINVYAEHLLNSHNVFRNFSSFIFRFASRPDFYNRMTIFLSYMRHDGTFDAYEMNKEGELIYNFNKDLRFTALSKGLKSDPKYREQEALYRAMARQFEIEGATYSDGTKFELTPPENGVYKPLPQAYTNKLARSYKAMADKMYGYYSHEKKALMQSSLIGALFWQMNTYWSGKKNLWFAISSVKDRGHFTHYSEVELDENNLPVLENGREKRKYYYFLVDENGVIKYDEPPVTEEELINKDIKVPVYRWEGNFSEGIAVTMTSMLYDAIMLGLANKDSMILFKGGNYEQLIDSNGNRIKDPVRIMQAVRDLYWNNPNENLRTAYRLNIKLLVYDMSVLLFVGGLLGGQIHQFVNDYTHEHADDHTVLQSMNNAALALSEAIFESATLDFDPTESIGGRGVNWTPFAISSATRLWKNWSRALSGDLSLSDALIKSFSLSKFTIQPYIRLMHNPALEDMNIDSELTQE